jgi:predicted HD phosphohydrolase
MSNEFGSGYAAGRMGSVEAQAKNKALTEKVKQLERQIDSLQEAHRQARSNGEATEAVRLALLHALAEIAPDHPLANPLKGNALRQGIYDERYEHEYWRNAPGTPVAQAGDLSL